MKSSGMVTILALMGSIGCSGKSPDPATSAQQSGDSSGIVLSGVVRKAEVGVGCWQFIADDSTHYELRAGQAPEAVLIDQKRATLMLKRRPDLMSNCMVGQIADVMKAE